MKKKLLLLNLVLLALVAGAVWKLRERWLEGQAWERKVMRAQAKVEPQPPLAVARPPQPVAAATYGEVAQNLLFARDRNPNVVIEESAPKPPPPLPVAHGVMDFGDGPVIMLTPRSGEPAQGFMAGDAVGDYKLVALNYEEIVLEWEGQQLKRKISELIARAPVVEKAPERRGAATTTQTVAAASQQTTVSAQQQTGPGVTMGGDFRACIPGDPTPVGTVIEGYRKIESNTPFGKACRWELVR